MRLVWCVLVAASIGLYAASLSFAGLALVTYVRVHS